MTKTAMTIVVASDCNAFMPPEWLLAGVVFQAGFCLPGRTVICGSVLTSLMTAQKIGGRNPARLPQNLLSMIVDIPRPSVQPLVRPASLCCLRYDGRNPYLPRLTPRHALPW